LKGTGGWNLSITVSHLPDDQKRDRSKSGLGELRELPEYTVEEGSAAQDTASKPDLCKNELNFSAKQWIKKEYISKPRGQYVEKSATPSRAKYQLMSFGKKT
jgi:hypothetical protein